MDNQMYAETLRVVKLMDKNKLEFPEHGLQSKHSAKNKLNPYDRYILIVNRKGHKRENTLSYQMNSKTNGKIARIDMTGPPHDDRFGNPIPTPHAHIFDDNHNQGRWAVPLEDITNYEIIDFFQIACFLF